MKIEEDIGCSSSSKGVLAPSQPRCTCLKDPQGSTGRPMLSWSCDHTTRRLKSVRIACKFVDRLYVDCSCHGRQYQHLFSAWGRHGWCIVVLVAGGSSGGPSTVFRRQSMHSIRNTRHGKGTRLKTAQHSARAVLLAHRLTRLSRATGLIERLSELPIERTIAFTQSDTKRAERPSRLFRRTSPTPKIQSGVPEAPSACPPISVPLSARRYSSSNHTSDIPLSILPPSLHRIGAASADDITRSITRRG